MKFFYALLTFFFITATVSAQNALPAVDVKTLDGKTLNLQTIGKSGKITVVSFWATWCTPCKKELDVISEVFPDWQKKHNMDLVAITIDNSRQLTKVPAMVESKGWEFTVLAGDQNEMQNAFNFQTIPQTFLVDTAGKIVWTHSGYVPGDEEELEHQIKLIAGK